MQSHQTWAIRTAITIGLFLPCQAVMFWAFRDSPAPVLIKPAAVAVPPQIDPKQVEFDEITAQCTKIVREIAVAANNGAPPEDHIDPVLEMLGKLHAQAYIDLRNEGREIMAAASTRLKLREKEALEWVPGAVPIIPGHMTRFKNGLPVTFDSEEYRQIFLREWSRTRADCRKLVDLIDGGKLILIQSAKFEPLEDGQVRSMLAPMEMLENPKQFWHVAKLASGQEVALLGLADFKFGPYDPVAAKCPFVFHRTGTEVELTLKDGSKRSFPVVNLIETEVLQRLSAARGEILEMGVPVEEWKTRDYPFAETSRYFRAPLKQIKQATSM